jgi:hypothetical protein
MEVRGINLALQQKNLKILMRPFYHFEKIHKIRINSAKLKLLSHEHGNQTYKK